ncbi:MAG TPA: histidine kinase [Vicinamibacterales bacterium]|nr:histidine kinase [Vicinamibacterales bacterium]
MRARVRIVLIVLMAATVAAAFSATLGYQVDQLAAQTSGRQPAIWPSVALNASFWYGWAILSLPLTILAKRFRIDGHPRLAVPIHIVAVLAAAFTHICLQTSTRTLVQLELLAQTKPEAYATASFATTWNRFFPFQLAQLFDWEIITGAAIIGFAHAYFYYTETQQRALREAQLETRLVEAQLQMLQRQLHPHFLFNTLHAISALLHRDVAAADRTLAQLSDLLRITLDSVTRPEIHLGEELEFLEKYVQIEQLRLGDRLVIRFDVDPDTLDALVPALILQPLVENAIKHGVAPLGRQGRVTVIARREAEMLVMTVTDTGLGPSERAMVALSTGIGVANTRARLAHQFGARFRFEFQRHDLGFTALVAFPCRREAAEASVA